ncbi:MAG: hypothetical protein WCV73_02330 [Patescibacteria group bacterium]|jgi:hypothetical protein
MLRLANLFRPKLQDEAMDAYFHRLPNGIQVEWFRDGNFIIGNIFAEGNKYMTQAVSANEFIEMVNDTLLAVYDIPKNYQNELLKYKKFKPSIQEFNDLNNAAIKKSSLKFEKQLA